MIATEHEAGETTAQRIAALSPEDEATLYSKLAARIADPTAYIECLCRSPAIVERFQVSQNICRAAFPADPWADWLIEHLIRDIEVSAARMAAPLSALLDVSSFDSPTAAMLSAQWNERQAAIAAEIPDYFAVIASADIPVPAHLSIALIESAIGPLIAYFLAQNPMELARLTELPPHSGVRELGKLEVLLARGRPAETLIEWKPGRAN